MICMNTTFQIQYLLRLSDPQFARCLSINIFFILFFLWTLHYMLIKINEIKLFKNICSRFVQLNLDGTLTVGTRSPEYNSYLLLPPKRYILYINKKRGKHVAKEIILLLKVKRKIGLVTSLSPMHGQVDRVFEHNLKKELIQLYCLNLALSPTFFH